MKPLYITLGALFFTLGFIGAFLPILPTVPFMLLASYFFAKGSKRYYTWLISTKLYQNHVKSFAENRSLTFAEKLWILLPVSALLIVLIVVFDILPMRIFLTVLLIVKYFYFIFCIKTVEKGA